MVEVYDDAKGGLHRHVEVLSGPGRRRKWSDEAKARIVADALEPGAVVANIARRLRVCPQQIFGWSGVAPHRVAPINYHERLPAAPVASS